MIIYTKVSKGTSKTTETTTGNGKQNNIFFWLMLKTHGTVQQKSNVSKVQSIRIN